MGSDLFRIPFLTLLDPLRTFITFPPFFRILSHPFNAWNNNNEK
jgi:hypothetical protein